MRSSDPLTGLGAARNQRSRKPEAARLACGLVAAALLVGGSSCGGRGRQAAATVTVTVPASTTSETTPAEPPPLETNSPSVKVRAEGFSQDQENVSYGVVLRNVSAQDALDVSVTTNFVDGTGTILKSESESISVLPAGKTYYLGGDSFTERGARVAHLETAVSVGSSQAASYPLPTVTRVRLANDEYAGLSVHGEVENTLDAPLSQFARISAVVFDTRGRVIGGGYTYLDADLAPGRRAAFEASIQATSSTASYARATAENSISDGE